MSRLQTSSRKMEKFCLDFLYLVRLESNTHETHQNGCDMIWNITTFHNPLKSYARIGRVSGSNDDNEMQTLVGFVVNLCVYVHCMWMSVCICGCVFVCTCPQFYFVSPSFSARLQCPSKLAVIRFNCTNIILSPF